MCSHVDGECTCSPGWTGIDCTDRVCPEHLYGLGCSMQCDCNNFQFCHPLYGCICLPEHEPECIKEERLKIVSHDWLLSLLIFFTSLCFILILFILVRLCILRCVYCRCCRSWCKSKHCFGYKIENIC